LTAAEYNNVNKDGALDAHWEPKTYDYWTSVHGRNSFDNAGAAIKVTFTAAIMIMLTGMEV
jgi:Zn-dependent metalloprotease